MDSSYTDMRPTVVTNVRILAYWQDLCPPDGLPGRGDIDPLDIPGLLPNVYLVDIRHTPLNFRYRLLGTAIVEHSMHDYTGMWVGDIPMQAPPSQIWSLYETVVGTRRPACDLIPYKDRANWFVEMQCMPLSRDGSQVDMLFGSIAFEREREGRDADELVKAL